MVLPSPIIALFLPFVYGVSSIGKPKVRMEMHETAIASWDDLKLPSINSHAAHPAAEAARQADDFLNVPMSVEVVRVRHLENHTDHYARESLCDAPSVVVRDNGEGLLTAAPFRVLPGNPFGSVDGLPFDPGYYHYFGNIEVVWTASPGQPSGAVIANSYQS